MFQDFGKKDETGNVQLFNYNIPLLVIPYRDDRGRIQACQLRLHRNDLRIGEKKYRWLGKAKVANRRFGSDLRKLFQVNTEFDLILSARVGIYDQGIGLAGVRFHVSVNIDLEPED